jgi:general secretion pathway protein E
LRNLAGAADGPMASASTSLAVGDEEIWLVASFMPTAAGEAATLLLFPRSTETPELEGLGVSETSVTALRAALDATSGVIMVGCGDRWLRSALLHALIPARTRGKIWSLETLPVFHRPTLNQTVLSGPADAAAFLRAVADGAADLVVLDDATDPEGLRAAFEIGRTRLMLVGHPQGDLIGILSETLDVVGSALVASTIRGILAARAVRLLCPVCKQPAPDRPDGLRTFVPAGCEACGFTGFRGRRLLADVWTADPRPRRMIRARETVGLYEAILRTNARMREQGLALVEDGLTSMEELTTVTEGELWRLPTSSS